jgi:riboflavin synthase
MFTGIIEEIGHIKSISRGAKSFTLAVDASEIMSDVKVGDSISTDGVCLTVTSITSSGFTADVMPETVSRTALSRLKAGSEVNLERALTLNSRLGGHIVSGHIDGTGIIKDIRRDDNAVWITVSCDSRLLRYIINKGSIAIQGVSLTVTEVFSDSFSVSLIPHTQQVTTLHSARIGDTVNLETDVMAKYAERLLGIQQRRDDSLIEKLRQL